MARVAHGTVSDGGHTAVVVVDRVEPGDPGAVRWLVEVDLQTFTENTWSEQTAMVVARHGAVFLLRADGQVIGTCACVRDLADPRAVVLVSMGLVPGWRGKGLGQWLLMAVLEALHAEGFSAVVLHVGSRNRRAVQVYEDVGFRVTEMGELDADGDRLLVLRAELAGVVAGLAAREAKDVSVASVA